MLNTLISHQRDFPTWHFSMLNDEDRNAKIEAAIVSADVNGKTVFEIGTGAGLAAMLFARHGARRIVTCEVNAQLYHIASTIFAVNGLEQMITIFNKSSTEVIDDGDLNFTPDIIFTETLDCGVVGEGFFCDLQRHPAGGR